MCLESSRGAQPDGVVLILQGDPLPLRRGEALGMAEADLMGLFLALGADLDVAGVAEGDEEVEPVKEIPLQAGHGLAGVELI